MLFGFYVVLFLHTTKETFLVYSLDSLVAFFPHEQVAYRFSTRFSAVYCESATQTPFPAHRNLCIWNRDRIQCADIFASFFLKVNCLVPTYLFCHCRPYRRCKKIHGANTYRNSKGYFENETHQNYVHLSIQRVTSVKTQLIYCQLKWRHVSTRRVIFRLIIEPCLTFRHRASSMQDRRFTTLQRTLFYVINQQIYFII